MITAQSSDGVLHQFPDGTAQTVVDRVMRQYAQQQDSSNRRIHNALYALKSEPSFGPPAPHAGVGPLPVSAADIGEMGKGIVAGALGLPGDVERSALRVMKKWGAVPKKEGQILPASQTVANFLFGPPSSTYMGRPAGTGFRQAGETIGSLIMPSALEAGTDVARGIGSGIARLFGRESEQAATEAAAQSSALRASGVSEADRAAAAQEVEAAKAGTQVEKAQSQQRQISQGKKLAAERARAKQPGFVMAGGRAVVEPQGSIAQADARARVMEEMRRRVRQQESAYREAGASAQDARRIVAENEGKTVAASRVVDELNQRLASQPGMSAEQFGAELRSSTDELADRFSRVRERDSGFTEAINSAGDDLRVKTQPIRNQIENILRSTRNPALESELGEINLLLTSDQKAALSVRSANSLRKYIDSILNSKTMLVQNMSRAVDKETLLALRQVKQSLIKATGDAWPAFRTALNKWRQLSKPLDIVERKGALRRVLDTDPVSTDHALTESKVTGEIIRRAREGNPVFTRLLEVSPQLKDSGRLYFSQDLFGRGDVPSESVFRNWLRLNEGPLKQLGLYDEFADMQSARRAALKAVEEAKGAHTESLRLAVEAEKRATEAQRQLARTQQIRDMARRRSEEGVESVRHVPAEGRSAQAMTRAQRFEDAATRRMGAAKTAADDFRKFRTEIETARPEEVPARMKAFAGQLRDKGILNDQQYADYLRRVQSAQDQYEKVAQTVAQRKHALRRLVQVAGAGLIVYFGWEGRRIFHDLLGQ